MPVRLVRVISRWGKRKARSLLSSEHNRNDSNQTEYKQQGKNDACNQPALLKLIRHILLHSLDSFLPLPNTPDDANLNSPDVHS